jgi:hypothetical protein
MNFLNDETISLNIYPTKIDQNNIIKYRKIYWYFVIDEYKDNLKNEIIILLNTLLNDNKLQYYLLANDIDMKQIHCYLYIGLGKNYSYIKKILNDIYNYKIHIGIIQKKLNIDDIKKNNAFIFYENGYYNNKNIINLNDIIDEIYTSDITISDLLNRDRITRYLIIKNINIVKDTFTYYNQQKIFQPVFIAYFNGPSESGKSLMINILNDILKCNIHEIFYNDDIFENFNLKLSCKYNNLFFPMLYNLIIEYNKKMFLEHYPKIIIITSTTDIPIEIKNKIHLVLKFNFESHKNKIPGYNRLITKINNTAIPLFLSYYKYHCKKYNINVKNEIFENIEAFNYDLKIKDDIVRLSDNIFKI